MVKKQAEYPVRSKAAQDVEFKNLRYRAARDGVLYEDLLAMYDSANHEGEREQVLAILRDRLGGVRSSRQDLEAQMKEMR